MIAITPPPAKISTNLTNCTNDSFIHQAVKPDKDNADGTHIRRSHVLTLLPAAVNNDAQLVPSSMSVILISPGGQLIGLQDSLSTRTLPSLESPADLQKPTHNLCLAKYIAKNPQNMSASVKKLLIQSATLFLEKTCELFICRHHNV